MHRKSLLFALEKYPYSSEDQTLRRFFTFVNTYPNCFERSLQVGHITGSAFVISKDKKKILLTLHKKLNQWFQLGGHADGEWLVHNVAKKEAIEESGMYHLALISHTIGKIPIPFDLDIHRIPKHLDIEAHDHYDVRYLFHAEDETFVVSDESYDLRWFLCEDMVENFKSDSLTRACRKILTMFS